MIFSVNVLFSKFMRLYLLSNRSRIIVIDGKCIKPASFYRICYEIIMADSIRFTAVFYNCFSNQYNKYKSLASY